MNQEQDKTVYDGASSPEESYSLDEILAEFGRDGTQSALMAEIKELFPREEEAQTGEEAEEEEEKQEKPRFSLFRRREPPIPEEEAGETEDIPLPPEEEAAPAVPLKTVVSRTVDSVLSDRESENEEHRSLSQRLSALLRRCRTAPAEAKEEPEEEPEESVPEPDSRDAERAAFYRETRLGWLMFFSSLPALALIALTVLTELEAMPVLQQNGQLNGWVHVGILLAELLLCLPICRTAVEQLRQGRGSSELTALILCAAALCHGIAGALGAEKVSAPLTAPAAVWLWLCMAAQWLAVKTRRESFRLINLGGHPLYVLTDSDAGLCRRQGTLEGFYRITDRPSSGEKLSFSTTLFLLSAASVLSGLVWFSGERTVSFFTLWSVMLTVSLPMSLPLTDILPLQLLQHKLVRSGCTVAGFQGARAISQQRRLVLTDDDVFPPGTVSLYGCKSFGYAEKRMISYAFSMAKASGSQLASLLEQQFITEDGDLYPVEDFRCLEDGGVCGTVCGEHIVMGSAYFMRRQHISLPQDLKVKTGVFLAVEGSLAAVFPIKYTTSVYVERAMHALRRSRLRPVLAVRSSNITPGLLKRRYGVDTKPVYPDISTRIALSDAVHDRGGKPYAVLYRDGLLPMVQTVIGARRLVRIVRWITVLTYFAALAGLLLGYYLTSVGFFTVLTPLNLLIFSALWLLPTLLLSGLICCY